MRAVSRREFVRSGAAGFGAFLGLPALAGCASGPSGPTEAGTSGSADPISRLGPLQAPDGNGVRLPAGFTSRVVARSGQPPAPGSRFLWHGAPDGGATYPVTGGGWIYVSNSEMGPGASGVGALRFDATGGIVDAYSILSGTTRNCAGGKFPANRWLSCEENGDIGLVYECDVTGAAAAVARPALGRFNHEAVTLDTAGNVLYLTEDRTDGGLYRFRPSALTAQGTPDLAAGTLEVAQVLGQGPEGTLAWHTVPDPQGRSTPTRYQVPEMTRFNGGEGIYYRGGRVYFVTKGDDRVWAYTVASTTLVVLYDARTSLSPVLTGVDGLEISAEGDVLVTEDGGDMQIVAITPKGALVPVVQVVGHDLSEVTGAAFSPDYRRLYFSSQRGATGSSLDGVTFEVTGPFAG